MGWVISGNRIVNSGNHGIHVSGRDIQITKNTIYKSAQRGIYVGDWRSIAQGDGPRECVKDINVSLNEIRSSGQMDFLYKKKFKFKKVSNLTDIIIWGYIKNSPRRNYRETIKVQNNSQQKKTVFTDHVCEI